MIKTFANPLQSVQSEPIMYSEWLRHFRLRLANPNSLMHLSVMGVLAGLTCSLITLAFRFAADGPSSLWMPDRLPDNFEALPQWLHFALPVGGALLIGLIMAFMKPINTRVGIVHVLTRQHADYGHLPLKNALFQFFGGAFAIMTGQSGGREGPVVHLGSAASSLLGQKLQLPNNSIRLMVGCGTAAAIAASFNTPIAGVIFAMEVIMLEYTVSGFIPIMLAAITGTTAIRAVYGADSLFHIPPVEMASLLELPFVALLGLAAGCAAALFQVTLKFGLRFSDYPALVRCLAAGVLTGGVALLVPEVMGIGYDSLNATMADQLPLTILLALIAAKILTTAFSTAMGLPIGLIGPNLLIGACIGGALGSLGELMFPELASSHSFYVLLGMGAMMGAVLNAPLAALMALMELTDNTTIIFPGMLAITIATLTTSELFKQRSAHQTILRHIKLLIPTDPISLALQRSSVGSLLQRNVLAIDPELSPNQIRSLREEGAQWYVVRRSANNEKCLIWHGELDDKLDAALAENPDAGIQVLELGAKIQPAAELPLGATLCEALMQMDEAGIDTLYVSGPFPDHGIITRTDIEKYTRTPV